MTMTKDKENHSFQAEVKQLLHLVIHSLYSHKEIFLRELISNASDALDKLRFVGANDDKLYEGSHDLEIWLDFNEAAKTITVKDTGIGMTKEEVMQNLGTIAKSGTKEFLQQLTGNEQKDSQLIGQFGVGFYSSFIVADRVTVKTRKAGTDKKDGVLWESDGTGEFAIQTIEKPTHGTEIILHLKDDAHEFLSDFRLRTLVKNYSDHISFPIKMWQAPEPKAEDDKDKKDDNVEDAKVAETVNQATALWTKSKSEITQEQYTEFYKHISHDFDGPLAHSHNKVEGKQEYTLMLFIPKHAPFDLFHSPKPKGLKLFVKRVFIMDEAEQFVPQYLRFIRGIVDSNDLPLNVSREILQSSKTVESIKSAISKRVLSMLEGMAKTDKEKYATFWKEFGNVLKEGPAEEYNNRERIAKLLRFASTHTDTQEQNVSLEEYVARMPKDQKKIYYIAADTFNAAKNSPHLEIFRAKGIEVLLLSDRIDEWLMSNLTEFDGKQFQSIAKGGLEASELGDEKEIKKQQDSYNEEFKYVVAQVKEALKDKVEDVRITVRLTDSPACIVAGENAMTAQMERLLKSAGQAVPTSKPVLELNPKHKLIEQLKTQADKDRLAEVSLVLLDQAILAEGGQLDDPATFVKLLNKLIIN